MKYLLVILLLLSTAMATDITDPKLVNSIDAIIKDSGKVTIINGVASTIQLNLTLPQETDYQTVGYDGTTSTDSEGNTRVNIKAKKPSNPFEYFIEAEIKTRERITETLLEEYSIPTEYQKFVKNSEYAQSDDPIIKEKAIELTEGYDTDFEKIAALAMFTNEYIEYDWQMLGKKEDALWVLENKKGVCVEYSNLFSALAKSLGYPTRYVLGQAYGKYGWLGHAWTEVYLGTWIPVDPTWLEIGHLDASHIPFVISSSPTAESRIFSHVTKGAQVKWDKHNFFGKSSNFTQIIPTSIGYTHELEGYTLEIGAEDLGFGEKTVAYLEYGVGDYRVIDLRLIPCQSDPAIITTEKEERFLLTKPGKSRVAYWVLEASKGLSPDSIYTCPLTLNSGYLEESTVDLKARKKDKARFTAALDKTVITKGEALGISIEAEGGATVTVILENTVKVVPGANKRILVTPEKGGPGKLVVFSDRGGAQELEYRVEEIASDIRISAVEAPAKAMPGTVSVSVSLENTGEAVDVELLVELGAQTQTQRFKLDKEIEKETLFDLESIGPATLKVVLKRPGGEVVDEQQSLISVYGEGSINIIGQEYEDSMLTLWFEPYGDVQNLRVEAGGETYGVEAGRVSFAFDVGESFILAWDNSAGDIISQTRTVAIEKEKAKIGMEVIVLAGGGVIIITILIGLALSILGKRKTVSEEVEERIRKKKGD